MSSASHLCPHKGILRAKNFRIYPLKCVSSGIIIAIAGLCFGLGYILEMLSAYSYI